MSASLWLGLALVAVVAPLSGVRPASEQPADEAAGRRLYLTHCASCHGKAGRGDGPMAPYLRVAPTNLAVISTRHEGVFPTELIQRIVDGRQALPLHGSAMPIWAMHSRRSATPRRTSSPRQRSAPSWLISARSRIAPASEVVWMATAAASRARALTAPPLPARCETSLAAKHRWSGSGPVGRALVSRPALKELRRKYCSGLVVENGDVMTATALSARVHRLDSIICGEFNEMPGCALRPRRSRGCGR